MKTWLRTFTWLFASALSVTGNAVSAAAISGQGTWESTLQGRDLDGNLATFEAYYDTTLNITWLADVKYAMTSGFDADGILDWGSAKAWTGGLDPYGSGVTGWRLPRLTDTGSPGCDSSYGGTDCGYNANTSTSEMAHMFFVTLGDLSAYDTNGDVQTGYGLTNTGPFSNLLSNTYHWLDTSYAPDSSIAWQFITITGIQGYSPKGVHQYAWAVHDGDVGAVTAAVPIPATLWLFGPGSLGLIGMTRRDRKGRILHDRQGAGP